MNPSFRNGFRKKEATTIMQKAKEERTIDNELDWEMKRTSEKMQVGKGREEQDEEEEEEEDEEEEDEEK